MTALRPQESWTHNDRALLAYIEWRRAIDSCIDAANRLSVLGHSRESQVLSMNAANLATTASRHLDGICLNGHAELTAAAKDAQQPDGQVTATSAGCAQVGDTSAARGVGVPPSPDTSSRAPASADQVLGAIESLLQQAAEAVGQSKEVATKFLCRARAHVNEGQMMLAARDIDSAQTVLRGG